MLDPVSGADMAERIRERLPDAPFTALEDVAHWPPLEAPGRVAATLLAGSPETSSHLPCRSRRNRTASALDGGCCTKVCPGG